MKQKIEQFLNNMKNKKVSDNTIMSYKRDLTKVADFFESNGIISFSKVTSTNINSYILDLEKQGKSPATIARNISSINTFFRYLLIQGEIQGDPTDMVKAPKVEKKIPEVLSVEEMERLLTQPNGKSEKAVRDKAMLELLYATGMRVSEMINLTCEDVNMQLGYVVCKNDKRERVIPFNNKVKIALSKYIFDIRNTENNKDEKWLFLNRFGKQMTRQGVWKIIKGYADKAEIKKDITPHIFRHSMCAHLLQNGKSLKEVQEIMGHIDIASTSIYSNV